MQCCGPTDPNRRRSDNLDKEIATWMKEYKNILKFLLLGKLIGMFFFKLLYTPHAHFFLASE